MKKAKNSLGPGKIVFAVFAKPVTLARAVGRINIDVEQEWCWINWEFIKKVIRCIPWKGTYSNRGWAHCEDCPVGHRCSWGKKYPCSANEYQHKRGATSCHLCPDGSFSEKGASGYSWLNQTLTNISQKVCLTCQSGYFVNAWRNGCDSCFCSKLSNNL